MKKPATIARSLLATLALLGAAAAAQHGQAVVPHGQGDEPDVLSRMLFDAYVVRSGKVNSSTRLAAAHILAERGRESGFWRDVLGELRKGDEETGRECVVILGKMLEIDAIHRDLARYQTTTGESIQIVPEVLLGTEVVDELLARAKKADRSGMHPFVVALARARVPEARALFRKVLDDLTWEHDESTRFHAAVGLAQLGDPAGYLWLLDHSSDPSPAVSYPWPERSPSGNLDRCCIAVLHDLSGREPPFTTRQDCETWWKLAGEAAPPSRRARLAER